MVFPTPALPSAFPDFFVNFESLLEGLSRRVHLLVCPWPEDALLWMKTYWRRFVLLDQPCSLGREGYGAVRKDGHPPSQPANEVTDVTARSLSCTCSCFTLPASATAAGSSPPPLFYQCLQLLHCLVTHLSNLCLPQLSPSEPPPSSQTPQLLDATGPFLPLSTQAWASVSPCHSYCARVCPFKALLSDNAIDVS